MSPSDFHEIVSGRRRGFGASLARGLLRVGEVGYSAAMRIRNRRYDRRPDASRGVDVPVVCIGNLTVGGTGKTPLTAWIARWFRRRDVRASIVSRGYGATDGARNDEALELEQQLPDVPHLQNVDRVAGARTAVEEFESQVVLLDDGFQHRRLRRDLDVVLLDALEPFGFGHVLPRGLLREPLVGLRRAGVVVLSRADLVSEAERRRIRDVVRRYNPTAPWCEVRHAPRRLVDSAGGEAPLSTLHNRRTLAFCGIGNPEGFRRTLTELGCDLVGFEPFADHHPYARADIERLAARAVETGADEIICTLKDLVKIRQDRLADRPLRAVVVEIEFLDGESALEKRLEPFVPATPAPSES